MKTVGDFKKVGLVFVKGDVCVGNDGHEYAGGGWVVPANEGLCAWDNDVAKSFAWRENTGVKPEFGGLVEWVGDSGAVYVNRPDELIWSDKCIAKWRPSLNQPSLSVESDTKQSAIHKAWVDLHGDLSNTKKYDLKPHYLIFCIKDTVISKGGKYLLTEYATNNDEYWRNVCTIQEFTDYCEKMAAEEKRMDIIGQNGNDGLHYDNTAQQVEALFADGMPKNMKFVPITRVKTKQLNPDNKPIFTQAMADAGEKVKVGMEFSTATGNYVALLVNENTVVFEHEELGFVVEHHDFVHPVDTRTDREKAIDAAMNEWPAADKSTLEMAYDFWRVGEKC